MVKRPSRGFSGPPDPRKRQKIARDPPTSEDVTTSRQLKKILEFQQDARNCRHGIQSFKLLLDAITSNQNNEAELEILSGYLDACRPVNEGPDAVYLPDVMEMWSYASQISNDDLLSEVAAALALLLQATSLSLSLLTHGRGVCETLLQDRQLKLVTRNVSADKDKGFVISPALRLLREVVSYDGGVFARRILRAQTFTFAELSRNLDIRFRGEGVEEARRPSVRTNAARFIFSCLKYLPSEGRAELLSQKGVMPGLLMRLPDDPPALIHEALECLGKHVLMDDKLPSYAKSKAFWARPMERLVSLYTYAHDTADAEVSVADRVHEFLMLACTSPAAGIIYPCNGLYPTSVNLSDFSAGGGIDSASEWSGMGLEQLSWMDQFADEVPVRNRVLLEVSLKLRPWASTKQGELLVAIFRAAPEIVCAYFLEHKSFAFDPKLSMTWIGYASFLHSAMELPLPEHFGAGADYHGTPPPTSVVLNNIIPLPLTQSALMRCFEPKWPLVSLFATRLLVLALEKLEAALAMHAEAGTTTRNSATWRHASRKLINDFCGRLPDMKEVVRWYKSIPESSILCRATGSRLLLLYYKVLPQVALAANFDVSPFLAKALATLDGEFEDPRDKGLVLLELENLLGAASLSPGMRWFNKLAGFPASPFTVLLKLACVEVEGFSVEGLRRILESVAVEQQVVLGETGLTAVFKAFDTLEKGVAKESLDAVWTFLDTCITRCASSPMKYLDLVPEYAGKAYQAGQEVDISLLAVAITEQLPFAVKSAAADDLAVLVKFISAFIKHSAAAGENEAWLRALAKRMSSELPKGSSLKVDTPKTTDRKDAVPTKKHTSKDPSSAHDKASAKPAAPAAVDQATLESLLHEPFAGAEDNSALTKWVTKSIDDIIEDSHATALIRLLGSEHASIRIEALTNILKLAAKIRASTHSEREQLWLLLSELAESSREFVPQGPVPSALTAFAAHAIPVLMNPLHVLYGKVNKYLTRAPVWPAGKIPLVHDVLHGEPSEDDRYYTELAWLFDYLLDCLRRPADVGVFHQTRWFEKVFAVAGNPYMKTGLRSRVFRVVYRATCVEGGSTTLVTRFGVLSWLEGLRQAGEVDAEERALVGALMERVWETCDRGHVSGWSRGGIPTMMGGRGVESVA